MWKIEDRRLFTALLAVAVAFFFAWAIPSLSSETGDYGHGCATHECREDASAAALAEYTKWLVVVTAVLAIGTLFQIWLLFRSDSTARLLAETTKRQFLSEHKPKITLRDFHWAETQEGVPDNYRIEFLIRNEGSTIARITEIATRLIWSNSIDRNGRPNFPSDIRLNIQRVDYRLNGGDPIIGQTSDLMGWDGPAFEIVMNSQRAAIFCVGYVTYADENESGHRTGFCRKWNFESLRWERYDLEEYEYAY